MTAAAHEHTARISWKRGEGDFIRNRYSRGHEWSFDGGTVVPASSSPSVVPVPNSVEAAVDPEEALVASVASCHMLWFLSLAARKRFVVESYEDDAAGVMGRNAEGRMCITRITLRPKIVFSGEPRPSPQELEALHHAAHDECFIANSLRSEIVVEPG